MWENGRCKKREGRNEKKGIYIPDASIRVCVHDVMPWDVLNDKASRRAYVVL